ncbi:MAG: hypothetical protein ACLFVP_03525 [Candidatus Bathyarchaeia archaeon]
MQAGFAVIGYLLGMAFAGSFLGRKWMGFVDILLHKLFKREVTLTKFLYWKHFCNIHDPPRPKNLRQPNGFGRMLLAKFFCPPED